MATKLRDIAKGLGMDVGCADHGCIWGSPGGMGTNGGCQCLKNHSRATLRMEMLRMRHVAMYLLNHHYKEE